MFEKKSLGERALIVHIEFSQFQDHADLTEFTELAKSAGADIIETVTGKRAQPSPKLFIGSGKAEEIAQIIKAHDIELVLFNHSLTPAQERNLEKACSCHVVDRNRLILAIFAKRARTFEGKLQVELAQLTYMATRLVRGWTHLERQRGGRIGLTGPGEKQLELDRRLLATRVKQINARLKKVRSQRQLSRQARQKSRIPTVALVGYTNAGKSTLFNRLTKANIYAANQLFATLDPTMRRVYLSPEASMVLADTVGFIRHLPHHLIEAFKATLEEVMEADLLLHVIDASDPDKDLYRDQVHEVLEQLGAADKPMIEIHNKIDALKNPQTFVEHNANDYPTRIGISAETGAGIEELKQALAEILSIKQR